MEMNYDTWKCTEPQPDGDWWQDCEHRCTMCGADTTHQILLRNTIGEIEDACERAQLCDECRDSLIKAGTESSISR